MSPVAYLLVSLCMTSVMLSVIFLLAFLSFGRKRHALTWSLTFVFAALQWLLNIIGPGFANQNLFWILVNAAALTAIALALVGHRQRAGLPSRFAAIAASALFAEALIVWFVVIEPHAGFRTAVSPAYASVVLGLCALILMRRRERPLPAEWGAGVVTAVFAMTQVGAAATAALQGSVADPRYVDLYLKINFLALPTAYTGMSMFVVLILASDLSEQMTSLAIRDQLTGILNRRGFYETAPKAFAQARRAAQPLSVIMADLDRFKRINDTYGHAAGDQTLQHVALLLADGRRTEDAVGRIGGDEFAIVLPGTSLEQACELADRLRRRLESEPVSHRSESFQVTASFGVSTTFMDDPGIDPVIERADYALYKCKDSGRNRVAFAATPEPKSDPNLLKTLG